MLINENLTNEEESDFNDKYTRILVQYPKEKTKNLSNVDLQRFHSVIEHLDDSIDVILENQIRGPIIYLLH